MKLFCVSYRRKLNVITYLLDIRYVIDDHLFNILSTLLGFPGGSVVKNLPASAEETQVQSWVRKLPWRRKWQPITVFLPGTSHG